MTQLPHTIRLLVWLLILTCSIGLASYFWLYQIYLPGAWDREVELEETIDFEITPGESLSSIAERLTTAGVVTDDWVLVEYLKEHKIDSKVEAGFFTFSGSLTVPQVAQQLQRGGTQQIKLTILEGWNSSEIDAELVKLGLIKPNEFSLFVREGGGSAGNTPGSWAADRPVASLEGYLFPATYFVDPATFSVEELVARMLAAMQANLATAGWNPDKTIRRLHAVLTMASIVELEERDPDNQPKVADILWRRLDTGMALGADATLFYTLGHKTSLTAADLALESPYNTRRNIGLPPTPIAAPGLSALKAAIKPTANDFWYYLHDTTSGQIHFASTLPEHNQNKAKYIR